MRNSRSRSRKSQVSASAAEMGKTFTSRPRTRAIAIRHKDRSIKPGSGSPASPFPVQVFKMGRTAITVLNRHRAGRAFMEVRNLK